MILTSNLEFGFLKSIFENPKSDFLIPLEYHFETPKFEFNDVENPQIYIFASKFKFFFLDQNLDFELG